MSIQQSSKLQSPALLSMALDKPLVHVIGLSVFFAFLTPPPALTLVARIGDFPLRFFDLLLVVALFLQVIQGSFRFPKAILPIIVLGIGFAGYFRNGNEISNFFADSQGFVNLLVGVVLFSSVNAGWKLRILSVYFISCLWVSAIVCLLIFTGRIENLYGLRSSFAGGAVSDAGMGRLLTPTFIPAEIALCLVIVAVLRGHTHFKLYIFAAIPSVTILILSGARTVLLIVFLTILLGLFSGKRREVAKRLAKASIFIIASLLTLVLFFLASGWKFDGVSYITNAVARASVFFTNSDLALIDESAFYRVTEISYAWQFLSNNLFLGGGFGAQYSDFPFVSDNSWLSMHGNVYLHESYLFLLVKFGMIGGIAFVFWLSLLLRSDMRNETYIIFLQSLLVFVAVSFFWNLISNVPDSLAIGALIGLIRANVKVERPDSKINAVKRFKSVR